jgi:predicted DNA-binding protein with PD1-like motif
MPIAPQPNFHSPSQIFVLRLKPHEDMKKSLQKFAVANNLKAAVILTCVGSLEQYNLRFANQPKPTSHKGHFEIVSLAGTLSETSCHLHLAISDKNGVTTGGHLMDDNLIYTTAEVAIAELTSLIFERVVDNTYGYKELEVTLKA